MQKSTKDLKGNIIGATDGDIGKVDDFYFDDIIGVALTCGARCTIRVARSPIGNEFKNGDRNEKKRGICICAALLT